MNEHSNRILEQMIKIIEDYKTGNLNLRYLVDGLEGSISALEEKIPENFSKQWYDHWGALEEWLSLKLEEERKEKILQEIDSLEQLITNYIVDSTS